MQCERCKKQTDVIKHIRIKNAVEKVFSFNHGKEALICMNCYHDKPEFHGDYLVETIRNG